MRKPTKLEALKHLNPIRYGGMEMLNGYEDGRWYVNGIVASKGDWIAVRLLYLMSALDPSNTSIAEVRNAHGYYDRKFGSDGLRYMFEQLSKDPKSQTSFEKNPDSKAIREFHKTLNDGRDEYEDITPTIQSGMV